MRDRASVRKAQNRIAQREFRLRKQVCPFAWLDVVFTDEIAIRTLPNFLGHT
jgi:hypothetical protein